MHIHTIQLHSHKTLISANDTPDIIFLFNNNNNNIYM